jgi:membrane-associated protein
MNAVVKLIDFIMHVDAYLGIFLQNYGALTYLLLFVIVFIETGLVITPFLPGDSLIFVAGAFAAKGYLNVFLLFLILIGAAILGDTLNYWIGSFFGEKIFLKLKFFKQEHLEKTKKFYEKHGNKTIILARFVPIVRTFAPFVAGIGKMDYFKFISYNIIGGIAWVAIFLFSGYFLGEIPFIEKNLTYVIFAIIIISLIPPAIEYVKHRRKKTEKIEDKEVKIDN